MHLNHPDAEGVWAFTASRRPKRRLPPPGRLRHAQLDKTGAPPAVPCPARRGQFKEPIE